MDEEKEIIERVRSGDIDAFASLMDTHIDRVRAYVAFRAPVPGLIDDITHETFVFAFRNIHKYTPGTYFRAWLQAIANNLLRAEKQRFARGEVNREKYIAELASRQIEKEPSKHQRNILDYLDICVGSMSDKMQELLRLKYTMSFSTDEIAEKLDRSGPWVRTTLFRVRKRLKDCVELKAAGDKA